MQASGRGAQTFHLVRRVHQAEAYEVWESQSSAGEPAMMVLLPSGVANNLAARSAFANAVAWAQRPDTVEVTLLSEDAIGVTPWAAIALDQQGRAVHAFLERLLGLPPATQPAAQPTIPPGSPVAATPVSPPAPAPMSGPPAPAPMSPPAQPMSGPPAPAPMSPPAQPMSGPPAPAPTSPPAQPMSPPAPVSGPPVPVSPAVGTAPVIPRLPQPPSPDIYQPPIYQPSSPPPQQRPPASDQPVSGGAPLPQSPSPWQHAPEAIDDDTTQPAVDLGASPWGTPRPSTAFVSGDNVPVIPGPSQWQQQPAVPAPQPWEASAYPAHTPAPDVPPLPGPGEWPSQQRRSRTGLRVALIIAGVLVLAAVATTAVLLLPGRTNKTAAPGQPTASASPSPSPSPTPHPTFQPSAAPVAVLGATWQAADATKVQDFAEWPFAFRTPADATCEFFVGEPDYKAYNCKWGTEPQHTVMAFVVHRCVNSCDATEQAQFESMTPWKPDATLTATDATTKFGDVNYGDGREQFTMVHYFGATPGGPLQWVAIVQGNAPVAGRDAVLKTINDVRSQTP